MEAQVESDGGTDQGTDRETAQSTDQTADRATDQRAVSARRQNKILGRPVYKKARVARYARRTNCTRFIKRTIPIYYKLARKRNIRPDVLIAQAIIETGRGRYTGDSRPWNMAGIKKGGNVGDAPKDFEKPKTARAGVRMHVNHMAAYTGKRPIGKPHGRFSDARAAQKGRGFWLKRISQLGGGVWATDPTYARKIRQTLNAM